MLNKSHNVVNTIGIGFEYSGTGCCVNWASIRWTLMGCEALWVSGKNCDNNAWRGTHTHVDRSPQQHVLPLDKQAASCTPTPPPLSRIATPIEYFAPLFFACITDCCCCRRASAATKRLFMARIAPKDQKSNIPTDLLLPDLPSAALICPHSVQHCVWPVPLQLDKGQSKDKHTIRNWGLSNSHSDCCQLSPSLSYWGFFCWRVWFRHILIFAKQNISRALALTITIFAYVSHVAVSLGLPNCWTAARDIAANCEESLEWSCVKTMKDSENVR